MALDLAQNCNLSNCCRLCLDHSCDELHSMFTPSSASSLANLILHLTGICPTAEDGLPGICTTCHNQISDFMTFRRKCQQTNAQLMKIGGLLIKPLTKDAEELNALFTEHLINNVPIIEQVEENSFEPFAGTEDEDSSDPLEGDESQSSDQFQIRKLSKRDLYIPKAYYGLCNICGKEYKHLWRHLESHNTEPVDRCKVCGKEFKSKTGLQMHVLMHQDAEHACDVCGKKYRTKNRLKRHSRVHTNDRPFNCDICAKKFYTKYNLEVHNRIHTGVKPYTCQFCGQQFSHSYAVKNHMDRFHLEILALKDP